MRWLVVLAACGPATEVPEVDESGSGGAETSNESSGAVDAGIVGVWVGYVDGGPLPSGSDRIEIRVTEVGADGTIAATIAFGEPGMLPPATDGDVGYPPGYEDSYPQSLFEQFAYTLSGTYDEGLSRLNASLEAPQLWADWCVLQTPYSWEDHYRCLPNCGFTSGDAGCRLDDCPARPGEVDCVKLQLCGVGHGGIEPCNCEASGCTYAMGQTHTVDLHREGDELTGPIDELGTAYLVRE